MESADRGDEGTERQQIARNIGERTKNQATESEKPDTIRDDETDIPGRHGKPDYSRNNRKDDKEGIYQPLKYIPEKKQSHNIKQVMQCCIVT
jgi:hypothetical protein